MKKLKFIVSAIAVISMAVLCARETKAQLTIAPTVMQSTQTLTPDQTGQALSALSTVISSNSVPPGWYVSSVSAQQTAPQGTNSYGATRLIVILKPIPNTATNSP